MQREHQEELQQRMQELPPHPTHSTSNPNHTPEQLQREREREPITTNDNITNNYNTTCPIGLIYVQRDDINQLHSQSSSNIAHQQQQHQHLIPKRVFQTSKSHCVAPKFHNALEHWHHFNATNKTTSDTTTTSWNYYLFDDDEIHAFFHSQMTHFPMLGPIVKHCLPHGTLKADLWRYLVLWEYGGIYSDLDAIATPAFPTETLNEVDALFVVEQYHLLSQYWMAVSPKHPLMWYAIQAALNFLLQAPEDLMQADAAWKTGPHALHQGLAWFAEASFSNTQPPIVHPFGIGTKPVKAGTYLGPYNRTVTVIGEGENQNEFINRDVLGGRSKNKAYEAMGMQHFTKQSDLYMNSATPKAGRTCREAITRPLPKNVIGSVHVNQSSGKLREPPFLPPVY